MNISTVEMKDKMYRIIWVGEQVNTVDFHKT